MFEFNDENLIERCCQKDQSAKQEFIEKSWSYIFFFLKGASNKNHPIHKKHISIEDLSKDGVAEINGFKIELSEFYKIAADKIMKCRIFSNFKINKISKFLNYFNKMLKNTKVDLIKKYSLQTEKQKNSKRTKKLSIITETDLRNNEDADTLNYYENLANPQEDSITIEETEKIIDNIFNQLSIEDTIILKLLYIDKFYDKLSIEEIGYIQKKYNKTDLEIYIYIYNAKKQTEDRKALAEFLGLSRSAIDTRISRIRTKIKRWKKDVRF